MATLTISVPDKLLNEARQRLASRGGDAIEEYLLCSLQVLADKGQPIDAELEAQLLEALDSPAEQMTQDDWDALHQRIETHRNS